MKTCFSEEQLREPPISTKPPISKQFFMTPPLCPNSKNETPPPYILGGGTMSKDTGMTSGASIVNSENILIFILLLILLNSNK